MGFLFLFRLLVILLPLQAAIYDYRKGSYVCVSFCMTFGLSLSGVAFKALSQVLWDWNKSLFLSFHISQAFLHALALVLTSSLLSREPAVQCICLLLLE